LRTDDFPRVAQRMVPVTNEIRGANALASAKKAAASERGGVSLTPLPGNQPFVVWLTV